MPRIPEYGDQQVRPATGQGGYINANVGADSFGADAYAGLRTAGQQVGAAASNLAEQAARQQADANETAAKSADVAFAASARNLLFDPQKGYFNLKGEDAINGLPAATDALRKSQTEAASTAKNPEAQKLFQEVAARRTEGYLLDMQRHAAAERGVWMDATSDARAQSAVDDAAAFYNQPDKLATYRATAIDETLSKLERHGMGGEVAALQVRQVTDKLHQAVVSRALAAGDVDFAKRYVADHAGEIGGEAMTQLQPKIEAADQKRAGEMLAQGLPVPADSQGVTPPAAAARGDGARGEHNNNPLNVTALPGGQKWSGQVGTDGKFAVFATPQDGWNAAHKNVIAYATKHGVDTVQGVVDRWAPTGDGANNPAAYAATVSAALGVKPDAKIDLKDQGTRERLLTAMAKVENGHSVAPPSGPSVQLPPGNYSLAQGYEAIAAAKGDPKRYAALEASMLAEFHRREGVVKDQQQAAWDGVQPYLQNPSIKNYTQIPQAVWGALSPEKQTELMTHFSSGGAFAKVDDPVTLAQVHQKMADDPSGFSSMSLLPLAGKLTDATYKSLLEQQAKARNGTGDFATREVKVKQLMDGAATALTAAGLNAKNPGDAAKIQQLQGKMLTWSAQFRGEQKRDPSPAEMHQQLDYFLLSGHTDEGMFGKPRHIFELTGQKFEADIPGDIRKQLTTSLSARLGRAPRPAEIDQQYYRGVRLGLFSTR